VVTAYKTSRQRIDGLAKKQLATVQALSQSVRQSLRAYQDGVDWNLQPLPPTQAGSGQGIYQAVNRRLRGQSEPDFVWGAPAGRAAVDTVIRNVTAAMKTSRVPEDVIAFRGIRSDGDRNGQFAVGFAAFKKQVYDKWQVGTTYGPGSPFVDKAFTSTTLDKSMAEKKFVTKGKPGIVIEYRIPKGTRGVSMTANNPTSKFDYTGELLLDQNLSYKVVGKYTDPTTGHFHAVLELV
jgi:hypothetical protein